MVPTSGQCGQHQSIAQAKGAYTSLIEKELRRAMAPPRITPSNHKSEWFGVGIGSEGSLSGPSPAPFQQQGASTATALATNASPNRGGRAASPSPVLRVILQEEQRQARHEAELRKFKKLAAMQVGRHEVGTAADDGSVTPRPKGGLLGPQASPTRFMGESLLEVSPSGLVVPVGQRRAEKHTPVSSRDQLTQSSSFVVPDPDDVTSRAKLRKHRQQVYNKRIGVVVTDQTKTSKMFATAIKDPVKERTVLLCDDSLEERRRLEQRNYALRGMWGTAAMANEEHERRKQIRRSGVGSMLLPSSSGAALNGGGKSSQLPTISSPGAGKPPMRTASPALAPEAKDTVFLNVMHQQTRHLEQQVAHEARGAWAEAQAEEQRRRKLLATGGAKPRPTTSSELVEPADEDELLGKALEHTGGVTSPTFDTRNRRQRLLQYMEDNKKLRGGARSSLEAMYVRTISPKRSASSAAGGVSPTGRALPKGYHQPSVLFPHENSMVYGGPKR